MGLVDSFSKEDRVEVKFSDFYNLVKGCTERDIILKGVKCDIPHRYMREMMTGEKEAESKVLQDAGSEAGELALASAT